MASPARVEQKKSEILKKADETYKNLQACWKLDLDWSLYPEVIENGCKQIGKALSMPPSSVICGLIILVSFFISHSEIHVEGTAWIEPVIIWLTVAMPSGSGKSPVYKYLMKLVQLVREYLEVPDSTPSWHLDVATFEKMGALMDENDGRLLGMYDKMTTFLTQINLYKARGQADSHDVAVFLQLYNGLPWSRKTVTGEANFSMDRTSLVVGGFTQPLVARAMIEQPGSTEKGIAQRFLWLFPKPVFEEFSKLEPISEEFTEKLVELLAAQLPRDDKESCKIWLLKASNDNSASNDDSASTDDFPTEDSNNIFVNKYNSIQKQLQTFCGRDDLISGFLSKSKGQLLRVATCFHVLFKIESPSNISETIEELPLKAAVNFIEVCCSHAFHITGRQNPLQDPDDAINDNESDDEQKAKSNAQYTILLPGKALHLTPLNNARKFRNRGNKDGGYKAFQYLVKEGFGTIEEYMVPGQKVKNNTAKSADHVKYLQHYTLWKKEVPEDEEELRKFRTALLNLDVSMRLYKEAYDREDSSSPSTPKKRPMEN